MVERMEMHMSNQVRDLLASFNALPEPDKRIVAVEILRRSPEGDLPTPSLNSLADELFAKLDEEEASRADR
jgi:hypothetical protein